MEKIVLVAQNRSGKPGQIRRSGFIPAVLNKTDTSSYPVQFDAVTLNRVISRYGSNARIWVETDGKREFGFVREIQKDVVDGRLLHVSIQLVTQHQEVRMQIPINYYGLEGLENRFLQLNIIRNEMGMTGPVSLLPEYLSVDVSEMEADDTILATNFQINEEIKILDPEDEVYAIVKPQRIRVLPETEETDEETFDVGEFSPPAEEPASE